MLVILTQSTEKIGSPPKSYEVSITLAPKSNKDSTHTHTQNYSPISSLMNINGKIPSILLTKLSGSIWKE